MTCWIDFTEYGFEEHGMNEIEGINVTNGQGWDE
jgi:hypothetical protein